MNLKELNERVSAARKETEARGETFYPGPSRIHLAAFPPKERWDDWVELESKAWPSASSGATCSCRRRASTASRRAGCSPTSIKRRCEVRKFEGNPEHPGSRGRNCAKGPATLNQVTDPDRILYPLKRAGKRGEGKWVQVSWDERSTTSRAHPQAIEENGTTRSCITSAAPARTASPSASSPRGASTVTTRTRTSARRRRARAISSGWGSTARARSRERRRHPAHQRAPRSGPLLQPARAARDGGEGARREAHRLRHAALEHRDARRRLGLAVSRFRGRDPARGREPSDSEQSLRPRVRAPLVELGRVHGRRAPELETSFEGFEEALKSSTRSTRSNYAARESGVDARPSKRSRRSSRPPGTRLSSHNWRSAAAGNSGGWQVARTLFLLNALLGAVATEGGVYPNAGTSSSRNPSTRRRTRRAGTI
jgi:hypothetical protein